MQVDFNKVLKNLDGSEMKNDGKVATLGYVIKEALMSQYGDQSGNAKIKRINIAIQIDKTPVQNFEPDEISMFITLVEQCMGPLPYYRVLQILDPKRLDAKPKE